MPAPDRQVFLGVDTGGTYTDAVLYDEDRREVLGKAKAPTDHDDLAVGIRGAIDSVFGQRGFPFADIRLLLLNEVGSRPERRARPDTDKSF